MPLSEESGNENNTSNIKNENNLSAIIFCYFTNLRMQ